MIHRKNGSGIIRQGDVLIKPIDKIPSTAKLVKNNILAYGEVTGHSHKIIGDGATCFADGDGELPDYVATSQDVKVAHDEHSALPIYRRENVVVRQSEFVDGAIKNVRD